MEVDGSRKSASTSKDDPFPISPAMLVNLREYPTISEKFTELELMAYGKRRWKRVQVLADKFWELWKNQYISEINHRSKWLRPSRNLEVGDVVLIKENTPRPLWPLAIVHKTIPSQDGLVRKAIVRLKGEIGTKPQFRERAIHQLVLLISVEDPNHNPSNSQSKPPKLHSPKQSE